MATITGVSPSSYYGYSAPTSGAKTQAAATTTSTAPDIIATLRGNSSAPLTYSAAGMFGAMQSTTSSKAPLNAQSAQAAVLAAENVVTQTMDSLFAGSSPSSSNSDSAASMFTLPEPASTASNPTAANAQSSKNASTQKAQDAMFTAQNAVTSTLGSLASTTRV